MAVRAQQHWHWRNPLPQGNRLNDITFGNSGFVAVGNYGTILSSSDGVDWVARRLPESNPDLISIEYGNGIYLVLTSDASVFRSADAERWQTAGTVAAGNDARLRFLNDSFVTLHQNAILRSVDGVQWMENRVDQMETIHDLAYGDGAYWLAGMELGSINLILGTSSDLISWEFAEIPVKLRTIRSVSVLREGKTAALITTQADKFAYSTLWVLEKGGDWTGTQIGGGHTGTGLSILRLLRGSFVATGASEPFPYGARRGGIAVAEAVEGPFSISDYRELGPLVTIGHGDGIYVALTEGIFDLNGTDSDFDDQKTATWSIVYSHDLQTWTVAAPDMFPGTADRYLEKLIRGNGLWAASSDYSATVWVSENGYVWSSIDLGFLHRDLIFAEAEFLATTGASGLAASDDLSSWVTISTNGLPEGSLSERVTWGPSGYLLSVRNRDKQTYTILRSQDRTNWQTDSTRLPEITQLLNPVGSAHAVVRNSFGDFSIFSEEGSDQTWSEAYNRSGISAIRLFACTGAVIAIVDSAADGGNPLSSLLLYGNEAGWSEMGPQQSFRIHDLACFDGDWFVLGDRYLWRSGDLIHWETGGLLPAPMNALYFDGQGFLAVGPGGSIAFSPLNSLWSDAPMGPDGWQNSHWFGWFTEVGAGWTFHAQHGWQFLLGETQDSLFFDDMALALWLWTARDSYPAQYLFADQSGWLWYFEETITPDRVYYDFREDGIREEAVLRGQ